MEKHFSIFQLYNNFMGPKINLLEGINQCLLLEKIDLHYYGMMKI